MPSIEPGSLWVLRVGDHSGAIAEVDGQTDAGSVMFRNIRNGKNQDDAVNGRVHTVRQEQFLALYERHYKALGEKTQTAFRQNNRMRKTKQMQLAQEDQVALPLGRAEKKQVTNGLYVHPGADELGISIEMITPDMAQAWLERGGVNRKPSERAIRKLVHAIQIGEWDLTGETIKLDKDGRVRDGQHRLNAIIRSGMSVPCIVVRGVKESAFDKIDTGKSRNMADVLSIHGHPSAAAMATAARGLLMIENYGRYNVGGTRVGYLTTPSNAQGLAYVEAHPEMLEAVHLADRLRKEGQFVGGTGLWAIVLTMFLRISQEQATVFVDRMIEGANLEPGSPILRLRNMYRGGRAWSSNTDGRERLLATVIKGWNAWRNDQLVQGLSWHDSGRGAEKFPSAE